MHDEGDDNNFGDNDNDDDDDDDDDNDDDDDDDNDGDHDYDDDDNYSNYNDDDASTLAWDSKFNVHASSSCTAVKTTVVFFNLKRIDGVIMSLILKIIIIIISILVLI